MKRGLNFIITFLIITFNSFGETANIASFNTLHLGWKSSYQEEKIESIANIISLFDIVAVQEVMKKDGVKKVVKELEKQTGVQWRYELSPYSVGSKRYREYYAFIYRIDKVKKIRKGSFYPEKERGKYFIREPYGAKFKIGDFEFTYVTVHSIYGKKKSERELEASQMIDVYNYFKEKYKDNKGENIVIIGGDFNLPSYNKAFYELAKNPDIIVDAIAPNQKTTIGKTKLASSYDHIFYPSELMKGWYTGRSGVIDFTNNNHGEVRKKISDHIPVFMEINTSNEKNLGK